MEGPQNEVEVSVDELKVFYRIDRELYSILVRELGRNPSESLQIMGFWLWMERRGSANLISKILSLAPHLMNDLADEALTCLNLIHTNFHSPNPSPHPQVPLTCSLSDSDSDALLPHIHQNRLSAYHDMQRFISDVYIPVLSDLMEAARRGGRPTNDEPLARRFTGLRIRNNNNNNADDDDEESELQKFGRTMFATFSKGYPVSEGEVKKFLEARYGECIEHIQMHNAPRNEQPLYAKIVLRRRFFIQMILQGENKVKFTINGKHVWIRQFVLRNGRLLPCGCPNFFRRSRSFCPHHP